jgi:hypothetical protein
MDEKKSLETQMVEDFQRTKSAISLEMLKTAFNPLIRHFIEKNKGTTLRHEDVKKLVEEMFEEAVLTYSPDVGQSLTNWVFARMEGMPLRLRALEAEIAKARSRRGS